MIVVEICLVGGEYHPRYEEERIIYNGNSLVDAEEQIAIHAEEVDYDFDKYFTLTVDNDQRCFENTLEYFMYILTY